jgi:cytochrome c553
VKRTKPLTRTSMLARNVGLKTKKALDSSSSLARTKRLNPISDSRRANPRRPGYDYQEFVLRVCFDRINGTYHRKPCATCGAPATDAHHVLPKQRIEALAHRLGVTVEEKVELLMDRRNGLALCARCHDRHEHGPSRAGKVPFWKLSVHNIEFAGRLDKILGTEECAVYIERSYPR